MAEFVVQLIDPQRGPRARSVSAADEYAAVASLRIDLRRVVSVRPNGTTRTTLSVARKRHPFPLRLFSLELAVLLAAGTPLHEGLVTLREKELAAPVAQALDAVLSMLQGGQPLSVALQSQPAAFDPLFVAVAHSSEHTRQIQPALREHAAYLGRVDALRGKLLSASVYVLTPDRLQLAKENTLRTSLSVMREALDHFAADKGRYLDTLDEMVDARYLRAVPIDPLTGGASNWVVVTPADPAVKGKVYDIRRWPTAPAMGACMPTGEAMARACVSPVKRRQHGFSYLWLLLALATGGAGLAAPGECASAAVQRERETELVFRGQEIPRAIAAYTAATPGQDRVLPQSLQALLEDRCGPQVVRHLRRLFAVPFTGEANWVLVRAEDGDIAGVYSRAAVALLRVADLLAPRPDRSLLVSDRVFLFSPLAAAAALPQE